MSPKFPGPPGSGGIGSGRAATQCSTSPALIVTGIRATATRQAINHQGGRLQHQLGNGNPPREVDGGMLSADPAGNVP
ncbi:MAG: hypothetical protein QOE51_3188 [Actinoplanes sp.]|jgi:hypothetical protein|nr:hypothetical protein [Actinoplanes sp.]